jgi:hypothetical protein
MDIQNKKPQICKKMGFIIRPLQSPQVYRWLKCGQFIFQYQIGYLDVKRFIRGLPSLPWRYRPPTQGLIAKKDVFLRTDSENRHVQMREVERSEKMKNLPPSRHICVYRRLQGVVLFYQ